MFKKLLLPFKVFNFSFIFLILSFIYLGSEIAVVGLIVAAFGGVAPASPEALIALETLSKLLLGIGISFLIIGTLIKVEKFEYRKIKFKVNTPLKYLIAALVILAVLPYTKTAMTQIVVNVTKSATPAQKQEAVELSLSKAKYFKEAKKSNINVDSPEFMSLMTYLPAMLSGTNNPYAPKNTKEISESVRSMYKSYMIDDGKFISFFEEPWVTRSVGDATLAAFQAGVRKEFVTILDDKIEENIDTDSKVYKTLLFLLDRLERVDVKNAIHTEVYGVSRIKTDQLSVSKNYFRDFEDNSEAGLRESILKAYNKITSGISRDYNKLISDTWVDYENTEAFKDGIFFDECSLALKGASHREFMEKSTSDILGDHVGQDIYFHLTENPEKQSLMQAKMVFCMSVVKNMNKMFEAKPAKGAYAAYLDSFELFAKALSYTDEDLDINDEKNTFSEGLFFYENGNKIENPAIRAFSKPKSIRDLEFLLYSQAFGAPYTAETIKSEMDASAGVCSDISRDPIEIGSNNYIKSVISGRPVDFIPTPVFQDRYKNYVGSLKPTYKYKHVGISPQSMSATGNYNMHTAVVTQKYERGRSCRSTGVDNPFGAFWGTGSVCASTIVKSGKEHTYVIGAGFEGDGASKAIYDGVKASGAKTEEKYRGVIRDGIARADAKLANAANYNPPSFFFSSLFPTKKRVGELRKWGKNLRDDAAYVYSDDEFLKYGRITDPNRVNDFPLDRLVVGHEMDGDIDDFTNVLEYSLISSSIASHIESYAIESSTKKFNFINPRLDMSCPALIQQTKNYKRSKGRIKSFYPENAGRNSYLSGFYSPDKKLAPTFNKVNSLAKYASLISKKPAIVSALNPTKISFSDVCTFVDSKKPSIFINAYYNGKFARKTYPLNADISGVRENIGSKNSINCRLTNDSFAEHNDGVIRKSVIGLYGVDMLVNSNKVKDNSTVERLARPSNYLFKAIAEDILVNSMVSEGAKALVFPDINTQMYGTTMNFIQNQKNASIDQAIRKDFHENHYTFARHGAYYACLHQTNGEHIRGTFCQDKFFRTFGALELLKTYLMHAYFINNPDEANKEIDEDTLAEVGFFMPTKTYYPEVGDFMEDHSISENLNYLTYGAYNHSLWQASSYLKDGVFNDDAYSANYAKVKKNIDSKFLDKTSKIYADYIKSGPSLGNEWIGYSNFQILVVPIISAALSILLVAFNLRAFIGRIIWAASPIKSKINKRAGVLSIAITLLIVGSFLSVIYLKDNSVIDTEMYQSIFKEKRRQNMFTAYVLDFNIRSAPFFHKFAGEYGHMYLHFPMLLKGTEDSSSFDAIGKLISLADIEGRTRYQEKLRYQKR